MNEQLQQALASMLNKTVSGVEAGAAFLQSEIPDVIQQLLIWKAAESIVTAIFGIILLILTAVLLKTQCRKEKIDGCGGFSSNTKANLVYDDDGDIHPGVIGVIIASSMGVLFGFTMLSCVMTALQIWLAPKIYLIEYATSLAK